MANIDNKYYRTYDANNQTGDFDDHDRYLGRTVTGNSLLKALTKGDPFKGVVNLVNTAKQFNVKTELTSLLEGSVNTPLDSMIGRLANMDNYKFQYGMNDLLVDKNTSLFGGYVDKIEDPTVLSFTMEIDRNNSPLFQTEGDINNFIALRKTEFPTDGVVSLEANNLIVSSNIGGLYDQIELILEEFQTRISEFFISYQSSTVDPYPKSYYITSVSGISELDKVWSGEGTGDKFEFSRLKLTMREDVKLSARNLYFLYNSLRMHRRSGKNLIPENLLRFNMWIKISEIRNFTSLRFAVETGANQDVIDAIKRDVTAIYYYIQDCSFDFSKLHRDKYSVEDKDTYEDLEFEIIFRRAHRVFKPTLLKSEAANLSTNYFGIDERTPQAAITNKNYDLGNFRGLSNFNSIRPSLMQELNPFDRTTDPVNSRTKVSSSTKNIAQQQSYSVTTQSAFQKLGKFLSTGQVNLNPNNTGGLVGKALNLASQAVTRLAQSAKNTVIQKRNQLVRDLENKVKNKVGFGIPRPDNIYKPGSGDGIIGTTLESLSKATGIDFLAIRNGQNIQSFANTDIQTLNPALEGRDILSGPGGDYSKLNPNSVPAGSTDIANLQPATNATNDVRVLNVDLQPASNFQKDTSVLQNIEPVVANPRDLNLLKPNLQQGLPSTDNINDLNTNLQQGAPSTDNINDIKNTNLQQGLPSTDDLKNLKNNLQQGLPSTDNINDLNTNLQQGLPSTDDLKNLAGNLQQGAASTDDINVLNKNLQQGAASTDDVKNLNVNLQTVPRTLIQKISFKNVNLPDQPVANIKDNSIDQIENANVDGTVVNTVDKSVLNTNLQTATSVKNDTSVLNTNLQQGTGAVKENINQNVNKSDTAKTKETDVNINTNLQTPTSSESDIKLTKINDDSAKVDKKDIDKDNVNQ